MSWISENLITFLLDLVNGAIDFFGEILNNLYVWMVAITVGNIYVQQAERFLLVIAIMLIALMVIKIVLDGYMLETAYDADADPFEILIKVAQAVAIATNSNWIFNWLFQAGRDFSLDLLGSTDTTGFSMKTRELLVLNTDITTVLAWGIIMVCMVLISLIVFTVMSAIRAAELVAMKLLFPLFTIDLLNNNREIWGNFIRSYVIAFFSYALQLFFYTVALKSYATATIGDVRYFISTIAWLGMAIKAPSFLEKYIFKTGVGGVTSGGLRMVAQTVVMRGARG